MRSTPADESDHGPGKSDEVRAVPQMGAAGSEQSSDQSQGLPKVAVPSISLPKGGGAIRGMGEKFTANPATGTAAMTVPVAVSPGRSGFGPQLSLSYDSGAGNGPYGFGWGLSVPSITRKTDQGLPQYHDAADVDVFLLSGAEDLVPVLAQNARGQWEREESPVRTVNGSGYRVDRYRPRIEGLFARIERWTNLADATDVCWRSISKDNITTWYGRTADSRVADPADASRIFTWLICQSHDDKGNVIVYGYKPEDSARIFEDASGHRMSKAHERNRTDTSRSAQRYLKRIRYGNRSPYFPALEAEAPWPEPPDGGAHDGSDAWRFEVVLDYGEHDAGTPAPGDAGTWPAREDPFSSYRAGFEVRTYRLCRRVLMFHHFPGEAGVGRDCLVRSTDFTYSHEVDPTSVRDPVYTFLRSVAQTGYRRRDGGYDRRSLPPVEFEYSEPVVQEAVEEVDPRSLENLPVGLDGRAYQWTDLHGEGIPGILIEQAGAWFYKRNLSPVPERLPDGGESVQARFAPAETVTLKPNVALGGGAELMDLTGDGRPDVVVMDGTTPGLYEHDGAEGWQPFRPFVSRLNRDFRDPNLKFVDLDGDGQADVLITHDDAFVWHPSLAEDGFGPARRLAQVLDEEKGPRVVFADGTQSIYLADLSSDGLTDIVRIRNGEVCYWPNLGHGRFGAKVTMDNAPWFDEPDQFDYQRIRLADIDGSGTADIIYLHRDGVRLYFNQSGNSWSRPRLLEAFPRVDSLAGVVPTDLLGNGTTCLVWSTPLPGEARRPMRYVNLMGGRKPHLLVRTVNNLGAETRVDYAPSTKFYLQDKRDGKPWITRLPFPVQVVERVETIDHISRNRFVIRYAYHHGYFDGEEREFRGFSMVEQWDTEQLAALADGDVPADDIVAASHVPPVHTRTWFHTGIHVGRDHVSDYFAGSPEATGPGEYFREPGLTDAEARDLLLPDTVLPAGLTLEEEREACRALKGTMLRQEVYADDAGPDAAREQIRRARTPYTVTEQNVTVRVVQPRGVNRHAVFCTHAREGISYHYERDAADPRIQHARTLEVDDYGNVLKQAAIGYGRRLEIRAADAAGTIRLVPNPGLTGLHATDRAKQTTPLLTYTENRVTNAIESPDTHRIPLPCEEVTFALTGYPGTGPAGRYQAADLVEPDPAEPGRLRHRFTAPDVAYEAVATGERRRRLIERSRALYRRDDLGGLLPLGEVQPLALSGESYQLAFTPGLLTQVFRRPRRGQPAEPLLPDPVVVLGGQGGYLQSQTLKADGLFPAGDPDDHWWIPSGRSFHSTDPTDPAAELAQARQHFFLPRRYRDPFGQDVRVDFDAHDLLPVETRDPLGNRVTAETNDYRVLQPCLVSDPNRNRTEVAFDTLGMVVGTAVMGKPLPAPVEGDTLDGFVTDLTQVQLDGFFSAADPPALAAGLLADATARVIYDLDRFRRTRQASPDDPTKWQPACAATLARATHSSAPLPQQGLKIRLSFSYSDGFGRVIQQKTQAEPGPVPRRDADGEIVLGDEGQPEMTDASVSPRWVVTGWTIFNNKSKPVRQYEPFFSEAIHFEYGVRAGVSPILFYDPAERVVITLHPNHTYEKVVFSPWWQATFDANDTVAAHGEQTGDPRTDPDIKGYVARYFATKPATWQTWYAQRQADALGAQEKATADKAAAHADTPTAVHLDTLGRPFLTLTHNGFHADGTPDHYAIRTELDIEGNQRAVRDALRNGDPLGRVVMLNDYDLLGNRISEISMDAGSRWMLADATGKPILGWDSRGHTFRTAYDALRRPLRVLVTGADPDDPDRELLTERLVYGEQHPEGETRNLRGGLHLHLDQAGVVTTERRDFKGNLSHVSRRLARQYDTAVDWRGVDAVLPLGPAAPMDLVALEGALTPLLEDDTFTGRTAFDALNRPVTLTMPDDSVIRPAYNEATLLERVEANLRGEIDAEGEPVWTPFVTGIGYDAKGRRTFITYGSGAGPDRQGVSTFYTYDRLTFRLVSLVTVRDSVAFPGDCPQPALEDRPGCQVQNLSYAFDPVGNITHIRDEAQQTIFFDNVRVEPSADYTYDALYRLIRATGREHLGQLGGAPIPHSHDDALRIRRPHPGDGRAMGAYTEHYVYDAVGNLLEMRHRGTDPAQSGWTRRYTYAEAGLIEPAKHSNRLSSTTVGDGTPEAYRHDAHGNIIRMPHLGGAPPDQNMHWDHADQLHKADLDGGGTAYYIYDASGRRVRKVCEKAPGLVEEHIYLAGLEIFRRFDGAGNLLLERETLPIMDGGKRIALVETRTVGNDPGPRRLIRYQFGNHLDSASLELDDKAQLLSYEEYTPYGSTSYQAVRSQTETPKRYRNTGKERDVESGLYYHEARYYAPWLGRWTSCDPAGLLDGVALFTYAGDNPIVLRDPGGRTAEAFAAGKAWERQALDLVKKSIPIVEQVTVKATINGKEVTSVLDALGRDAEGWVVLESKLNPTTPLTDAQKLIREHLASGKAVTIAASDKAKVAEIQSTLKVGPDASLSTSRYKIIHQGNAGQVLADLKAIPKGHGTILHKTGELTVHSPDEMRKITELLSKTPGLDSKKLVEQARKELADEVAKKALKEGAEGAGKKAFKEAEQIGKKGLKEAVERVAKKKVLSAVPVGGIVGEAIFAEPDATPGEILIRGIGSEIGLGPLDLTTMYDIATSDFVKEGKLGREDSTYIYFPGERVNKQTGEFQFRPGPKW